MNSVYWSSGTLIAVKHSDSQVETVSFSCCFFKPTHPSASAGFTEISHQSCLNMK